MSATIVNAAPMVYQRGTEDLSTRQVERQAEVVPQHLPKSFIYAEKGPSYPQLVVGDSRDAIYGVNSFDLRKQWANHSTVLNNLINAEGNAQMIERMIPADAGPNSNFLLSIDIVADPAVQQYQRNSDGSFFLNGQGNKVALTGGGATYAGFRAKWVLTTIADKTDLAEDFGAATVGPGDITVGQTQSTRYPIFEVQVSSQGSYGNNRGLRLWAPTANSSEGVKGNILTDKLAYPYRLAVVQRADAQSSAVPVATQFAEQYVDFTFKRGVIDPVSDKTLYIGNQFLDSYQNIKDPRYVKVIGDFGQLAVYEDNIADVLELLYTAEFAHPYSENDFTGAAGEMHKYNFLSGYSSNGAPYNTLTWVTTGSDTVRLTEFSNLFAKSGSDGTMSDAAFGTLVAARMAAYADRENLLNDLAENVESIIYDSGFPLDTKLALCQFISVRKDTVVVLSTHTAGNTKMTASEEHSLAVALRTRLQFYPESDFYGTPVMRGVVVGRSGILRDSQFDQRVPVTFELAVMAAKYMGAANGAWKADKSFEGSPGSILSLLTDISITFTGATARQKDWDIGLNWVQRYDRSSYHFPAIKTVYPDDTSVLNSFCTVMAIAQINKVAHAVHREFTGRSDLAPDQLIERVNTSFSNRIANKFAGRYVIIPKASITGTDAQRGYAFTLPVTIGAPNMVTVMTTYTSAQRIGDVSTT